MRRCVGQRIGSDLRSSKSSTGDLRSVDAVSPKIRPLGFGEMGSFRDFKLFGRNLRSLLLEIKRFRFTMSTRA